MRGIRLRRLISRQKGLWLAALVGVGFALLLILLLSAALGPVLTELAGAEVERQVTEILNRAVECTLDSEGVAYADLVAVEKDQQGRVTLLSVDTVKLNSLRVQILEQMLEEVGELDSSALGVPLGALTGLPALSGWGPSVPVRVYAAAVPAAEFSNAFTAQGVNQTLHQIFLDMTVEVTLLLPGGKGNTSVSARVCLAETLLVGGVPQTYLSRP